MQSGDSHNFSNHVVTLTCNQSSSFNRNLISLVKQWDKDHRFRIVEESNDLTLLDEEGVRWDGPEALPIIFKNLPFGRLAAAMYTLPGTMWFTKQLYTMQAPQERQH